MAMNSAAALCIEMKDVSPDVIGTAIKQYAPSLSDQEVTVLAYSLAKPPVTWVLAVNAKKLGALDDAGRHLARSMACRVWALSGYAGTVDYLEVKAFSSAGEDAWNAAAADPRKVFRQFVKDLRGARVTCAALGKYDFLEPRGDGWSGPYDVPLEENAPTHEECRRELETLVAELRRAAEGLEQKGVRLRLDGQSIALLVATETGGGTELQQHAQLRAFKESQPLRAWALGGWEPRVTLSLRKPLLVTHRNTVRTVLGAVAPIRDHVSKEDPDWNELERLSDDAVFELLLAFQLEEPSLFGTEGFRAYCGVSKSREKVLVPRLVAFLEENAIGVAGYTNAIVALRGLAGGSSHFAGDQPLIARIRKLAEKTRSVKVANVVNALDPRYPLGYLKDGQLANWEAYRDEPIAAAELVAAKSVAKARRQPRTKSAGRK